MTDTKRLVLDLPAEWVDMIEARVARGEFASADAFILHRLEDEFAIDEVDEASPEFQAWLKEGDEIVARLDAGKEPTYTIEEVRAHLRAKRQARRDVSLPPPDRRRA